MSMEGDYHDRTRDIRMHGSSYLIDRGGPCLKQITLPRSKT